MLATLATILKWLVLLPVFAAVVLLAIVNDQTVTVHLNPFDAADPVLRVDLALYQLAFILFALGVLIGGAIAWLNQGRYRRRARRERSDAAFWQARAERSERREAGPRPAENAGLLPRPGRG
jgi:hypothetical protein